jgi:hypothetical protein
MTKRECLLSAAWTGLPLTLAGRELSLPFGRFEILRLWDNIIFGTNSKRDQSEIAAVYECAWVMFMTRDELAAVQSMTPDDFRKAFADWCLDHEDELPAVKEGIAGRLEQLKAAMVESVTPGKEDARHAS